jgi:hypothetical protein
MAAPSSSPSGESILQTSGTLEGEASTQIDLGDPQSWAWPELPTHVTFRDLIAARRAVRSDLLQTQARQQLDILVEGFYIICVDRGARLHVKISDLSQATLEASVWCARERIAALVGRVPDVLDRALVALRTRDTDLTFASTKHLMDKIFRLLVLLPCDRRHHNALCCGLPLPRSHGASEKVSSGLRCGGYNYYLVRHSSARGYCLFEYDHRACGYVEVPCPTEAIFRNCSKCRSHEALPGGNLCARCLDITQKRNEALRKRKGTNDETHPTRSTAPSKGTRKRKRPIGRGTASAALEPEQPRKRGPKP